MIYLLLTADSFRESALEELGRAARYRIIGGQHNLILADIEQMKDEKALDGARFIYSYFPLYRHARLDAKRYMQSLNNGMAMLKLSKKTSTKLECFEINCKQGYSAKDIEVAIGKRLERDGYNIDLVNPEILAYCILMDGMCYFGYIRLSEHTHGSIDPFRYNKEKSVSRAEFKIIEAFREFGLAAPKIAIDMGASPGGWSLFLAKSGASVIAIDGAKLEYEKIRSAGVKVTIAKHPGKAAMNQDRLKPKSIIHFRCVLDEAAGDLKGIKADFIGDDINVGGIESSRAVIKYLRFMEKDAVLIMTVKCMHRNVDRYIKEVESALKPKFRIMRWKVLPHNRQEITLFARRR